MSLVRGSARVAAAAVVLLLAACATRPVQPPAPVDQALARHNDLQRGAITDWHLTGRVAVSADGKGGSGRIEWQQQGERYTISLSAPVTRQSWRLTGDASGARLEGVDGGPREGADAERMLLAATGWRIPVRAMVAWVRGIPATEGSAAQAQVSYGAGNVPSTLEQVGWRIDYRDWHPATASQPALPRRIEAMRMLGGDARLRLLVDEWRIDGRAPDIAPSAGLAQGQAAPSPAAAMADLPATAP
jgi:outer membrane lipoprotein LolB